MHTGAYGFFLVAATLTGLVAGLLATRLTGLSLSRMGFVLLIAAAGGLAGARLLHAALNLQLYTESTARLVHLGATGFSLYGGLLLGAAAGALAVHLLRLDLWRAADTAAVAAGAGVAVYRIGCFSEGCCFGQETGLPWGISYPILSPAWAHQLTTGSANLLSGSAPVHPTQLYELAAGLFAAGLAVALIQRRVVPGTPFLAAGLWFTAFRLFNWELRVPPATMTAPGWFYPAFYGLLLLAGAMLLFQRLGRLSTSPLPPKARMKGIS